MKKILLILLLLFSSLIYSQTVIFTESMGTVSATTTIVAHETANGFDNDSFTMSNGGATNPADIRVTNASTGYTGASGTGNVWFTSTAGQYGFSIEGIDASGYSNLTIQFGYRKESSSSLPTFTLDYWNGTIWVNVPFTFSQAANVAVGWYLSPQINLPEGAQINNLKLRWLKTGSIALRMDDVKLTGSPIVSPPSSPIATSGSNILQTSFTANWNSVSSATTYLLDVSTANDFSSFVTGYNAKDVGNLTSSNVTGLTANTQYFYRVRAGNASGTSGNSNTITVGTLPISSIVPTATGATNNAQTSFTANWNAVTGASKYFLDVSTQNDFATFVSGYESVDVGNVTSVSVTGLSANTVYHYRVRASNASGLSVNSNVISVTTLPNTPAAPTAIAATSITTAGFTVNWNSSAGATKYFLDLSTQNDFASFVTNYENKDVANVTSFVVSSLAANTQYYYRVRAYNSGGTSVSSNVINVTTSTYATQTLAAGDIAIIGIHTDDPDQFSFVPFVDLQAGTVIRFTDSGVKADGTFRGSEGAVKYTTPAGGVTAGAIITFTSPASGNFTSDNDATVGTSGVALSASGDQVTAFQGSSTIPTFIYSVTTHRNIFNADASNSNETALPTGLTNGTTAVAVGAASADNDNAVYNMSVTSGTRNELLAAIGSSANWTVSNTTLTMPTGTFTIGGGSVTIPNSPIAQNATNITASGFTANWSSSSGATKYFLDVASDNSFNNKLVNYDNKDVGNSITSAVIGLNHSTNYYYRVRANNSAGTSSSSNIISAATSSNQTLVQFSTASGSVNEIAGTFNLVFTITNPDPTNATSFQVALTGGTGSASDINNYTTQSVTFPAGSSSNRTIILTVTNDAVAEGNETVIFTIQNVSGGNNAAAGVQSVFSLTISDPVTGYYTNVNTTLTGSAFKTELHNLIKGHTAFPYTSSATDVWDILSHAYQDPAKSNNVLLIYTGISQEKTYNASIDIYRNDPNAWNREHVWAQSRGGFDVDNNAHNPGVASDAHNLAPEDASVNSDRGNKDFDIGGNAHTEAIGCFMDADSFEPRDAVKGDVARMLFYMDVRYEGTNGEVQLELQDGVNTPVGTIGKLSTLLLWHQQDPPDSIEIKRNDVIFAYQGNKNPFIDNPDWVSKIYGVNAAPTISNISRPIQVPAENQNLTVNANIIDDGGVASAQVIYTINNGAEQTVNMNLTSGTSYSGVIHESAYVDGSLITYKIKAVDNQANERISESYRLFTGTTSIAALHKTDANGELVYNGVYARVSGTATVPNGLFSSSHLEVNLQDATGGIVIYKVTAAATSFVVGRKYTVVGSLTQYNGLAELIPDNASTDIIDGGAGSVVQPTVRTFAQLMANPESYEGMLIKVPNVNKTSGTWANGQNLTVNDGTSSAVTIRISSGTNLAANLEPAWPKDVVGVFSQFDSSSPFTDGYQLKPRAFTDIQNIIPPVTATKYIVTSSNYNPAVGTNVTITAQLADDSNNAVATAGKVVNWSSTGGGSFSSATSTTDVNGIASVNFTSSTTSEAVYIITASDNSAPTTLTGSTSAITTQSGAAVKYIVTANDYNPEVNSTMYLSAQLVDAFSNMVKTAGKTVNWSSTNGGAFQQQSVLTNSLGRAEVLFTVSKQAGTVHLISVTDNESLTGVSAAINTKTGSAASYKLTASNYQPAAGSIIFVTAQLVDAFENTVALSGKSVTWKVNNEAVFASQASTLDSDGKTSVQLTVNKKAGVEHIVEAVDNSASPLKGKTDVIKTIPGVEAKYLVAVNNSKPLCGTTVTITAQLVDTNDNLVQKAGRVITWSSSNGGTFSDQTSTTDNSGKVSVEFTVSVVSSTSHKVTATDGSLVTGVSVEFVTRAIDIPKLSSPANKAVHIPQTQNLSWQGSANADSYELILSSDMSFVNNVFSFQNLTSTNKEVANLVKAKTYYWKVKAKKGIAFSDYSEVWSFTTVPNIPAKPVLSSPLTNSKNVRVNTLLSWLNIEGAENYNLQFAEDVSFTKMVINKTGITDVTYSVQGLKNSQDYFWRVKAINISGESDYTEVWNFTTIDTILAPTGLTAVADTTFTINLEWKDNSNNETGFVLERLDEGNLFYYQFDRVGANTTSYTNKYLEQGKSYTYRIKAVSDFTCSPFSNLLTVAVPRASIKAPSNLNTTVTNKGHVILTWNYSSSNDVGFIIYRAEEANNVFGKVTFASVNAGFVPIDTVLTNTTKYLDNATIIGKTYKYQVVTLTKQGVSVPTTAPAPIKPLVSPTNLIASLDGTNANLSWIDNSGDEAGFIVLKAYKPKMQFKAIDTTLANTNSYSDKNVFDGRRFHYKVYAYNKSYGVSGETNTDSVYTAMKTPTNLKAVQLINQNKINLSWVDNSVSETGYIIERKESGQSNFNEIATVITNIVSYTDVTIANKKNYHYRIKGYNEDGHSAYSPESSILVGVENEIEKPAVFALEQNYPNPFNPSTTIAYSLPERVFVKIRVFDLLGKEVEVLINQEQDSGNYKLLFNAASLSSGTYFYVLDAGNNRQVKKLIIVK
ncbi:MAG: extracellular ribonuclease [Ignavibacteria bacterium]|nr:MAG: extracellular ribonuclease [Ignavibacteria bacterium]KAF0161010.1 MAG: extracellular ribonuclease [Ignavibacteria bacterium]